jgi:DNA-binding IclR family transcriptional regulator
MDEAKARSGWGGGIDRVVMAIEYLALAEGPVRLSTLAQALSVPKSAAHRILTGLVERGWVERDQGDTYVLTLRMALLGQRHLSGLDANNLHQPILDQLAARTRELVRLTAVQNDALVWIGSARGRRSGLVYEADMTERIIPFATANGKVWLASLPIDEAVRIALEAGLGQLDTVPRAVQSIQALSAELEATRERGYGLAMEEAEEGVAAVAVPIRHSGRVVGTMSVAGPVGRMGDARVAELLPELRRAAESMALVWAGRPASPPNTCQAKGERS